MQQVIKNNMNNAEQLKQNMPPKDRKTEAMPTQAQGTHWVPGDTKRSKIEDKLTEKTTR